MKKKINTEIENELFERTHRLMEREEDSIKNGKGLYSLAVHNYLQKEYFPGLGHSKRNIILPMPRDTWYPKQEFLSLETQYSKDKKQWPRDSHYCYSMDCLTSKALGFLYFGYVMCEEGLFPCAFLMQFLMTMKIDEVPNELFPEEFAIDPMALASSKKPLCYIGVLVPRDFVEKWLLSSSAKHPLEQYVSEQDEIRLKDSEEKKGVLMGQQEMLRDLGSANKECSIKWLLKS